MQSANPELTIAPRFNGPDGSANGGYVAGRLAQQLGVDAAVQVTLRAPPPLGRALRVLRGPHDARLYDGERLVAEATETRLELQPTAAVSLAEAQAWSSHYSGFRHHVYPRCFVCGPERAPADGLRIFAGPGPDAQRVAAPWQIDASLADASGALDSAFVWAALDCPGYFASADGSVALLGRMTAELLRKPSLGDRCVVVAWPLGREGRKAHAASALFDRDGQLLAWAKQTWILASAERA